MKRLIVLVLMVFVTSIGWQKPAKKLRVEADLPTWQAILNVIDLSEAPPKDRVAVREFIIRQLDDTAINKK